MTFGCLNNFAKLSSATLGLWIPILQRIENSKLILHSNPGPHLNVLREALATAGITADRLEFVSKKPWPAYINTYNRIDIALDRSRTLGNHNMRCTFHGCAGREAYPDKWRWDVPDAVS